jgi:hypothetical protein
MDIISGKLKSNPWLVVSPGEHDVSSATDAATVWRPTHHAPNGPQWPFIRQLGHKGPLAVAYKKYGITCLAGISRCLDQHLGVTLVPQLSMKLAY